MHTESSQKENAAVNLVKKAAFSIWESHPPRSPDGGQSMALRSSTQSAQTLRPL